MNLRTNYWNKLFLFSLGMFLGTAFCMKWIEADFWAGEDKFTIIGLEIFYPRERIINLFNSLDNRVRTILGYHLYFDFAFMAGAYPGISSLCMITRVKTTSPPLSKLLLIVAFLQMLAWAGDIIENFYLLQWLRHPVIDESTFAFYHFAVILNWLIAIGGVFCCAVIFLFRKIGSKST
ncbi:hypothetical protein [Terrimonas alba]|uniref:hypothetical protein n=1 Tax=Terrimonas alba TaxID=3349636 RepID=UPI0035F35BAE